MAQSSEQDQLEGEVYYPSPDILNSAHVQEYETLYHQSLQDPQSFWAERAGGLEWYEKWEKVLDDSNPPFYKWFTGGVTNIVHNSLDRHMKTYRKNKLALIWEGEPGDVRTFSYYALNREICKFANVVGGSAGDDEGRSKFAIKRGYFRVTKVFMPWFDAHMTLDVTQAIFYSRQQIV